MWTCGLLHPKRPYWFTGCARYVSALYTSAVYSPKNAPDGTDASANTPCMDGRQNVRLAVHIFCGLDAAGCRCWILWKKLDATWSEIARTHVRADAAVGEAHSRRTGTHSLPMTSRPSATSTPSLTVAGIFLCADRTAANPFCAVSSIGMHALYGIYSASHGSSASTRAGGVFARRLFDRAESRRRRCADLANSASTGRGSQRSHK